MVDEQRTGNGNADYTTIEKDHQIGIGSRPAPDYEMQFDYRDDYDSLTIAIAESISDVKGVPVTDIVPPMSDVVDPGALEQIFRPLPDGQRRAGWVTFFLHGLKIVVSSDGWIRIYDLEEEDAGASDPTE